VGSILAEMWRTKGEGKPEGVPYKVEGIGQDKIPGTLDMSLVDDFMTVSDKESFAMARRLTREEGLFVGGSSGLIVHVALHIARRLDDPNALVVAPLPDTGERYLSKLYNDEWMRENQLLDADRTTLAMVLEGKSADHGDTPGIVSVTPGQTVRQALRLMSLHDVSQLPVMEGSNCVGSVSDWSLSAKSLEDTKMLDATVGQIMDAPFPMVDVAQPADAVAKLLSKSNPAVLVRSNGAVKGIVTRSDMLNYLMAR
jgi:cystathionine beta-synthase